MKNIKYKGINLFGFTVAQIFLGYTEMSKIYHEYQWLMGANIDGIRYKISLYNLRCTLVGVIKMGGKN